MSFYCPQCQADIPGDYERDMDQHRIDAGHPTREMIKLKHQYTREFQSRVPQTTPLTGPVVCVTGPMGSGTRLLTRVIGESGVHVINDLWHASSDQFIGDPRVTHVVAIFRDKAVTEKVFAARHGGGTGGSFDEAAAGVQKFAPHALRVSYEELMSKPDHVIAAIAAYIGISPWRVTEVLHDQNKKWADGPAPEINTPETLILPLPDWY